MAGAVFGGSAACGAAAAHNHITAHAILSVRVIISSVGKYTCGQTKRVRILPSNLIIGLCLSATVSRREPRLQDVLSRLEQYHDVAIAAGSRPSELYGGEKVVNAYRSGDYIGRFLWRNDACNYSWTPKIASVDDGKREEFCIGAGAHTHYWDHTAPPIADRIDKFLD